MSAAITSMGPASRLEPSTQPIAGPPTPRSRWGTIMPTNPSGPAKAVAPAQQHTAPSAPSERARSRLIPRPVATSSPIESPSKTRFCSKSRQIPAPTRQAAGQISSQLRPLTTPKVQRRKESISWPRVRINSCVTLATPALVAAPANTSVMGSAPEEAVIVTPHTSAAAITAPTMALKRYEAGVA